MMPLVHWLFGLGMAAVIVTTYRASNPEAPFNDPPSARIMVFHVPCHWVALLAFFAAMVFGIRYLARRRPRDDVKSVAAAEIGFLFAGLGTVTGAVFAARMWKFPPAWFYWDFQEPRVSSIFILLLVYAAYFALRSALDDAELRATLSGVYSIIGFIAAVFLMFVMPRIMGSLHPPNRAAYEEYHWQFYGALVTYTWLYFWMWSLRVRAVRHERLEGVLIEQPA